MGRRLIATLAGLTLMVSCGVRTPVAQVSHPQIQTAATFTVEHGKRMFAGLELTDAQKDSIKAIIAKYKCGTDSHSAGKEAIKAAIIAPTVDTAALTAAIQDKIANREAKIDKRVAMLNDIRNVLTTDQRNKIVERLNKVESKEHKHRHHRFMKRLAEKLKMTDAQKDAFKAVHEAYAANKEEREANRTARHKALAAFMTSGDTAALKEALLAIKPNVPVDKIVAAIASLSQEQREKLVDIMAKHKAKRCEKLTGKKPSTMQAATDPESEEQVDEPTESTTPSGDMPEQSSSLNTQQADPEEEMED